jgi:hypothetical protein
VHSWGRSADDEGNSHVNLHWFSRRGIFFFPSSLPGWLIAAATAVWLILTFIDIDSRSHSVSDTLMNFAFNAAIIAAIYALVGYFSSAKR